jgi:hypothetical protein
MFFGFLPILIPPLCAFALSWCHSNLFHHTDPIHPLQLLPINYLFNLLTSSYLKYLGDYKNYSYELNSFTVSLKTELDIKVCVKINCLGKWPPKVRVERWKKRNWEKVTASTDGEIELQCAAGTYSKGVCFGKSCKMYLTVSKGQRKLIPSTGSSP